MCDILVALPDATASGKVLFGKNSDRPAGECQVLSRGPGPGAESPVVQCAYRDVPATPDPLRTLGCRPYWCWGYETGKNEAGVTGGNTAIYTRARREMPGEEYGLLGMELLRLALERGETAEEAVGVVVELLERYGQWGPSVQGQGDPGGCYENAFIFADGVEAWRLETAGRRWVAKRQREGTLALSNELSIRDKWTRASGDLEAHAGEMGWSAKTPGPFDFALAYSDHENYARQVSHIRWQRANELLSRHNPEMSVDSMKRCLRDHYENTFLGGPFFSAYLPDFLTLCMHDSPAGFTWGNTATSVVTEIDPGSPAETPYWVCYQPPCSSVYAAFFLDAPLPEAVEMPGSAAQIGAPSTVGPDAFDERSLWWRMYRLLGGVAAAPAERFPELRREFDALESDFDAMVVDLADGDTADKAETLAAIHVNQIQSIERKLQQFEEQWNLTGVPGKESDAHS